MCTVLLPPGVNTTAVDIYININMYTQRSQIKMDDNRSVTAAISILISSTQASFVR